MKPADENSTATSGAAPGASGAIGLTIRRLRKALALTQEELAHEIGVTVSTVNRWENGKAEPLRIARRQLTALAARAGIALD